MKRKVKISTMEMACYQLAKKIRDYDIIAVGTGTGQIPAYLAKKMHAPHCTLFIEVGVIGIDETQYKPAVHVGDMQAYKGAEMCCDFPWIFHGILLRGYCTCTILGATQCDKYGNLNTTVIGDYYKPKFRMPGSGGGFDFGTTAGRTLIYVLGGEFVEKVDYITTPGWLTGYDSREKAGIPGGPDCVVSTWGVCGFDKVTKEMYLESYYPWVTVEEIKEEIPWDLKVAPDVHSSPLPTDEEVKLIRDFAPRLAMTARPSTRKRGKPR